MYFQWERSFCINLFVKSLFSEFFLQGDEGEPVCPAIMCTLADPDPVPECQLLSGEVEEPEEEVTDEGRERESDRDSAVESTQGSETSDSLIQPGDKDDTTGDLFFPGGK